MTHLIDGDGKNLAPPARHRLSLKRPEPLRFAGLQTKSRVQVGAHEIVLELRRFVERVHEQLA